MNFNKSLWNRWIENAQKQPNDEAIIHWRAGKDPERLTWSTLINQAKRLSDKLTALGVNKGDVCAIIFRHHSEFYPLYMSVIALGGIPAVLQYPNPRTHPDKFNQGIEGMCKNSGLDWVLTEKKLGNALQPILFRKDSTLKGILFPLDSNNPALQAQNLKEIKTKPDKNFSSNDDFILQHSSGTTGLQKAVMLSHETVLAHVDAYAQFLQVQKNDKIVSWLPFYHDMGLIAAFQLSLAKAIPLIQIDPFEWVTAPILMLEAFSKEMGTLSWIPNFAYNLMTDKIIDEELENINLSSCRMIINCSEPIRYESMEKFYQRFQTNGLRKQSLSSAYAMAETTFVVTQSEPDAPPVHLFVNREVLAKGEVQISSESKNARCCVSSGKIFSDCQIRIVDEKGNNLTDLKIGELMIQSKFMFKGYRNNPKQTEKVLREGWYYSGDIGFCHKNHIFVIGRKKDVIIVGGNNLFPEDIEDTISEVEDVLPGRVVAFGEYDYNLGTEQVHVIAETESEDQILHENLRAKIRTAAAAMDVTIRTLHLVPPRWLIKSSSGKLSRKANRDKIRQFIIKE